MFFTQLMRDIVLSPDREDRVTLTDEVISIYVYLTVVLSSHPQSTESLEIALDELKRLRTLRDNMTLDA